MTVPGYHDVVRFEIAVHDAGRVRLCEALGHLLQITQELPEVAVLTMDLFAQGDAINKLHCDEVKHFVSITLEFLSFVSPSWRFGLCLTSLVDVRDVGVVQRSRGCGFLDEAAHAIVMGGNFGRQNLESNSAVQTRVFR